MIMKKSTNDIILIYRVRNTGHTQIFLQFYDGIHKKDFINVEIDMRTAQREFEIHGLEYSNTFHTEDYTEVIFSNQLKNVI